MVDEGSGISEIGGEASSSGGSAPKAGGKFPLWAIWTIVGVAVLVVIGIAVGVTLALTMGGEGNKAPVISTLTAAPPVVLPGGYSTITCAASDPEGSPVTYAWTATGGTISGIGSIVSWIAPGVAGTFTVGVTVSDGEGGTADGSVTVAVSGATPTATTTPTPITTPVSTPTSTAVVSYGAISIASDPAGAAIYIDGTLNANVTPYTVIHVTAGTHLVRIVHPGDASGYYKWRQASVTVYGGETTYINWVLDPATVVNTEIQPDGTAGKDAFVDEGAPDTNYETETMMSVGSAGGNDSRMYVQFDLSSIPSTSVILSADLGLFYYAESPTSVDGPVGAYRVSGNWVESSIVWNNQPSVQSTPIDTVTVPGAHTGDFVLWDISTLAQGWVGGSIANRGVLLRDTDETSYDGVKSFRSSDWGTAGERPKIVISYYDPAP